MTSISIPRRTAMQTIGAMTLAASAWRTTSAKTPNGFLKAVKIGMVQDPAAKTLHDKFKLLKDLGFDGVELDAPSDATVEAVLKAKEATGLQVPGVVDSKHWEIRLSDADPAKRDQGRSILEEAVELCKGFGGSSVLLVPGKVTSDAPYKDCWDRSVAEIKKVIPVAEKHQIDILIENVWNDFLTDPKEMAKFIDECKSSRVGAHFDIGNAVRYSAPHEWIPILGKRIKKLDIKDYKKSRDLGAGFKVKLREGDVDWPKVMNELRKIDYVGWGAAEIAGGDRVYLADVAKRMDEIFSS